MANKYGASEVAGPGSGRSKGKVAARRAARKESGMSAQKYYVQTRMAEAAKSGKTLDRAALRKKFQSGDVARKGFGAPKRSSSSSSSSSKKTDTSPTTDSSSRRGYKSPTSRTTSTSTKRGTGYRSADAYGSSTGPVTRYYPTRPFKSKYNKSENRLGKFIKNELLGVDDFKRVGKYVKSGQYGKALKSAGAGAFELGTSALTVTGVGAAAKGASAAAKGASAAAKATKAAKTAKTAAAASKASKATKAAAATKATKARVVVKSSKASSAAAEAARETARARAVLKVGQIGGAKLGRGSGNSNSKAAKPNPYLR